MHQRGKIVVGEGAVACMLKRCFIISAQEKFDIVDNVYNLARAVQLFTKPQGKIAPNNKTLIVIGVQ
ncbi:hypothetical protein M989_01563 [Kluyvera georgiana ATCC 51603]|uniref:Uncharacterized protein n=1 Tax=Kluyvera georgiana ATCC 51603 TaxID=1354264 RepID=A0A1B7K351_9ENTR|nr:hypothetical protein [Kluyvera georgiana]OAT54566.1 hypothetical protein M989_01563 [Kluyvera georgiana ATCC 51603]